MLRKNKASSPWAAQQPGPPHLSLKKVKQHPVVWLHNLERRN